MAPFRGVTAEVARPPEKDWRRERIRAELSRRFPSSQIEIRDPAHQGAVTRQGRVLTLVGDQVPAKPFRVIEVGGEARVRQHVMDFARVDIGEDGALRAEPAPLTLIRGTRMVVLDIRVTAEQVRLRLHSAEPLGAQPDGDQIYGCTEFVFRLPPTAVSAGVVEPVVRAIEQQLSDTLVDRTCRPGIREVCLQP